MLPAAHPFRSLRASVAVGFAVCWNLGLVVAFLAAGDPPTAGSGPLMLRNPTRWCIVGGVVLLAAAATAALVASPRVRTWALHPERAHLYRSAAFVEMTVVLVVLALGSFWCAYWMAP